MILLIDNYDSFTYNLRNQIERQGREVTVVLNDKISLDEIRKLNPSKIVISPGPGRPEDAGITLEVIKELHRDIPILGVCLGHQAIGQVFGSRIVHAKQVLHGKTSEITHNGEGIFKGIPNPVVVARYHSLAVETCPEDFILSAWTKDNEIMAIRHKEYPLFGIQFHPESFMTESGEMMMKNFLDLK
jgi:anthranilate synthase component 2